MSDLSFGQVRHYRHSQGIVMPGFPPTVRFPSGQMVAISLGGIYEASAKPQCREDKKHNDDEPYDIDDGIYHAAFFFSAGCRFRLFVKLTTSGRARAITAGYPRGNQPSPVSVRCWGSYSPPTQPRYPD